MENCIAGITLNCEEPWNATSSLKKWMEVLVDITSGIWKNVPANIQETIRNECIEHLINPLDKSYKFPEQKVVEEKEQKKQ
jgi:hypothetical protein